MVFLCDGPATLELYDALIERLASRYTVIAFETPGNGFSVPKPAYSFSFQRTNNTVARFLKTIAGERSILAFSCGGAYSAIDIAVRFPELCSHLIIIQAPSWSEEMSWKKRRDPTGAISTPVIGQILFPRMMRARAPQWYELSMAKTSLVNHFCSCTDIAFSEGATFALPTLFQNYLDGAAAPFGLAEQPALVIWGEQDRSHEETDKASAKELAKNVDMVSLSHVGHFPELEDPESFAILAADFAER